MHEPKVSVIVPTYNCEKYIEKCIKSIADQTLQPIEIIVINDGSTDDSGAILDSLAQIYDNMVVVHKDNEGVSSARNMGLPLAKGEYIGFVDSDDYIASDMFEKLYSAAKSIDADMVMCDYNLVYESRIINNVLQLQNRQINTRSDGVINFYLEYIMRCHVVTNKIFRTSKIQSAGINFEMNAGEDFLFCIEFVPYAEKVYMLSDSLYNYVQRKSSITNSGKPPKRSSTLMDQFIGRIQNNTVYQAVSEEMVYHYIFALMFTGFMFSPSCTNQPVNYFTSGLKTMRKWDRFPEFCFLISRTDRLSNLYKMKTISMKFYCISKIIFFFCTIKKDNLAAYAMFLTERLIYLKKKRIIHNFVA